jgi:hypothetical protein
MIAWRSRVIPPMPEEYVCQSRLTSWMSSALVTEALLLGVLRDLRGPVHRAFVAQLLERLERGPVVPQLAFGDQEVFEGVRFDGHAGDAPTVRRAG